MPACLNRIVLAFALALVASPARADDRLVLAHSGYLLSASDTPVSGTVTLRFKLFDSPAPVGGEVPVWDGTSSPCSAVVAGGFYAVSLGSDECGATLRASHFGLDAARWLEVSVDGVPLLPRSRVGSLPTAEHARDAATLAGLSLDDLDERYALASGSGGYVQLQPGLPGTPQAGHARLTGTVEAGHLVGEGSGVTGVNAEALGGLSILDLDARFAAANHAHAGVYVPVNGGVAALAGLSPLSAKGDLLGYDGTTHVRLPAGSAGQVLVANPAAASGLAWATNASGSIPASATPPVACGAATGGALYFDTGTKRIMGCNGTSYVAMSTSGNDVGTQPSTSLTSCEAIHAASPASPSGPYYIDPNGGDPADAYQVYCRMDVDDGGWELALNLDTADGNARVYNDTTFWTSTSVGFGTPAAGVTSDFKSIPVFTTAYTKVLVLVHREGVVVGWRAWNTASPASLASVLANAISASYPAPLTSASTNADVVNLDSREVVVRPNGNLRANMQWGAATSYDLARLRNDLLPNSDNAQYGLGSAMNVNDSGFNAYPGCEAGSSLAWDNYYCIGTDRVCTSCGTAGGTQSLDYDYAIFFKGAVPVVAVDPALLGNSAATAATSCGALHAARTTAPSGTYWISPTGGAAYRVYCEMSVDSGGWTLAMNLDTSDGNVRAYHDTAFWAGSGAFGNVASPLRGDYRSAETLAQANRQLMIMIHRNGIGPVGYRSWNLVTGTPLATFFTNAQSTAAVTLTAGSLSASVGDLDSREVVVRPTGELKVNMQWGASTSYDLARLRSGTLTDSDNAMYGLGSAMNVNDSGFGYYPACEAGSSLSWPDSYCIGSDRQCSNCGSSGGVRDLEYDYAIFVRDPVVVDTTPALVGNSQATAALGCADVRSQRPTAPSRQYWIDPNGGAHDDAYRVWCEQAIDGGGWTLALNLDTNDGNVHAYHDTTFWTSGSGSGDVNTPLTSDFKAQQVFGGTGFTKLLIRIHQEDTNTVGWRVWNLAGASSLQTIFGAALANTTSATALTGASTNASVGSLSSYENVVRPPGILRVNEWWGASTSYDVARIRNDSQPNSDNAEYGLGSAMNVNDSGFGYYPACEAGSTAAWPDAYCIGSDRACSNCGGTTGSARPLEYDYAIYLK